MSDADPTPALEVDDLSYRYKDHLALEKMSFSVGAGALHGFVGPNGAGKTTTLKIVSTLLMPQRNKVRVFGKDVAREQKKVRREIGFMPDSFAMYRPMKVFEYLDFFAAAYGQTIKEREQTINDVLDLTDMGGRRDHLIRSLSRGMQQRVCLARVLVHDPKLLLLDEPASGLDPRARIELMEILKELVGLGKTIFISSHILGELADLCDEVSIVDRGQIKFSGNMRELLAHGHTAFDLRLAGSEPAGLRRAWEEAGVSSVEELPDGSLRLSLESDHLDTSAILEPALRLGAQVRGLQQTERKLDEVFLDLTEPGVRQ